MAAALDLTGIPVVDNHCHALEREQRQADVASWRSHFTESPHQRMRAVDAADTAFYRRLLHAMAAFYGVPDDEHAELAILAARAARSTPELAADLLGQAGVVGLVVDTGYPAPDQALDRAALVAATGVQQVDLLRLELLFQDLLVRHPTLDSVEEAVRAELRDVRASGFAGFKSIAGYRTGLGIERWDVDAVAAAHARARTDIESSGTVRLGHKPLLDTLLHIALSIAARSCPSSSTSATAIPTPTCAKPHRSSCAPCWRSRPTAVSRSSCCTGAGRTSGKERFSLRSTRTPTSICPMASRSCRWLR